MEFEKCASMSGFRRSKQLLILLMQDGMNRKGQNKLSEIHLHKIAVQPNSDIPQDGSESGTK